MAGAAQAVSVAMPRVLHAGHPEETRLRREDAVLRGLVWLGTVLSTRREARKQKKKTARSIELPNQTKLMEWKNNNKSTAESVDGSFAVVAWRHCRSPSHARGALWPTRKSSCLFRFKSMGDARKQKNATIEGTGSKVDNDKVVRKGGTKLNREESKKKKHAM